MPPSSPTWGTDGEVKPPGWGARVRRKWGDPLCTLSSGWPGSLEAINWFHSSCNEMEMKLPDRGALSWGRMVASSWAWTGSAPPALPTPLRPPEAAAPGAPWPRSRGRPRASVPRITARRGLRVSPPVVDTCLSVSALAGHTHSERRPWQKRSGRCPGGRQGRRRGQRGPGCNGGQGSARGQGRRRPGGRPVLSGPSPLAPPPASSPPGSPR